MQARHIPSVVVTVIHHGEVIKTEAYGQAQDNTIDPTSRSVPAGTQTVYRLDSLTKQFTATAIMKLVEQDLIDLDVPIHRYIAQAPASWEGITVRHLITHQAGFAYQLPDGQYPSITEQDEFPGPETYLTRLFAQQPEIGKHIYSNIGYELLGVIIKNVTQQSYSAFMQDTFFTPLGMLDTGVTANTNNTANFAIGYVMQSAGEDATLTPVNSLPQLINEDIPLAGAGILSTIEDMAIWERALQDPAFLNPESQQTLWESSQGVWTPGKTDNGTTFLSASGVGWGYNTSYIRYPASQSAVIIMANLDGTQADSANIPELAFEIAQLYSLDK